MKTGSLGNSPAPHRQTQSAGPPRGRYSGKSPVLPPNPSKVPANACCSCPLLPPPNRLPSTNPHIVWTLELIVQTHRRSLIPTLRPIKNRIPPTTTTHHDPCPSVLFRSQKKRKLIPKLIGAPIATARNGCWSNNPKTNAATVKITVGTIGFSMTRFSLISAASRSADSMVLFGRTLSVHPPARLSGCWTEIEKLMAGWCVMTWSALHFLAIVATPSLEIFSCKTVERSLPLLCLPVTSTASASLASQRSGR